MRMLVRSVVGALLGFALLTGSVEAGKIRVVASLPDLKALTEAVGGDLVTVDTLARASQNPHGVQLRPSLMVKLRRAHLLIRNGVAGDPWVEALVQGSNNGRLLRGNPGHVDVSRGVEILGVPPGRIDRSMGDVHPEGNPHFTLDPATAPAVTAHILEGLARLAPEHRATFEANRRDFLAKLDGGMARWQQALAAFRGAKVVVYHDTWPYFLRRFGLDQAATIENRPGIPPSPSHLAEVIRLIKEQQIRVIMHEPWANRRLVARLAADSGARAVALASAVGAVRGTGSYLDMFEYNITALAEALR